MDKRIIKGLFLTLVLVSCYKVPITNRKQTLLFQEAELIGMSVKAYTEFLSKNPAMQQGDPNVMLVQKVGNRIKAAVEQFLKDKKMLERIQGYKWEFNVVNSKQVNAWCMPGGKVVVYTGLLPVTLTESGLAVVMGHEIAHAIARHGNERMSQTALAQFGGQAIGTILGSGNPAVGDIFMQSYGIGSSLGLLAYSRKHESEADKLGVVFMAMAGYDPKDAIAFWERMSKGGGGGTLEILSTHPNDKKRIADLQKFMPNALKYYKPQ
jgi:predicted Zn-dependent protease